MDSSIIKRRQYAPKEIDIPLIFQLVILQRNRKEVMYLCTRSSLALRIISLCEMAINKEIVYNDNVIVVQKASSINIYRDFQQSISEVKFNSKHLIKFLNGEKTLLTGLKDLRNKVYKEMEARGLIKIKKGLMFNKIILNRNDIWQNIFDKIVYEATNKSLSLHTIALLNALNYINGLETLLLQCNEATACILVEALKVSSDTKDENILFNDLLSHLKK